jgi:hypothetical protein
MKARFAARVLALLLATPALAAPPVTVVDGRVSARLEDADANEVLAAVAAQGGLEIRGALRTAAPVSIQLDAVPLADALPRLLAGQSFLLTYAGGRLKGVLLVNGSEVGAAGQPPSAAVEPALPPDSGEAALAASHREVAIGGRLARAVGADHTSFSQILGVAMHGADPRVRADALRVGLRILDDEPALRDSVLLALDGVDDAWLAAWLTRIAGEHAPELARRAARTTRIDSLRLRAEAVGREFAAQKAPAGS